jgi:Zn finger protein HypA/HybF involved in hydrogenase expression
VVVRLGLLASVEPARLIQEFALLSAGTPSHRARLDVEALPPELRCGECGCELSPDAEELLCPECGQNHPVLLNAEGLELKLVEFSAAHAPCSAPEHAP